MGVPIYFDTFRKGIASGVKGKRHICIELISSAPDNSRYQILEVKGCGAGVRLDQAAVRPASRRRERTLSTVLWHGANPVSDRPTHYRTVWLTAAPQPFLGSVRKRTRMQGCIRKLGIKRLCVSGVGEGTLRCRGPPFPSAFCRKTVEENQYSPRAHG